MLSASCHRQFETTRLISVALRKSLAHAQYISRATGIHVCDRLLGQRHGSIIFDFQGGRPKGCLDLVRQGSQPPSTPHHCRRYRSTSHNARLLRDFPSSTASDMAHAWIFVQRATSPPPVSTFLHKSPQQATSMRIEFIAISVTTSH